MSRVQFPCLWFDGNAEEAAELYVGLLPDSRITKVWRAPAETPSGPEGMVLTVDFTVGGQQLQGLTAGGGEPGPCGWLKDRFGLSWQIVPRRLNELLDDPDRGRARRAMDAMLQMHKIEVAELERAADAA